MSFFTVLRALCVLREIDKLQNPFISVISVSSLPLYSLLYVMHVVYQFVFLGIRYDL